MKNRNIIILTLTILLNGYFDFDTEEGEFKTDEEMVSNLFQNIDEFNVLVETKKMCDVVSTDDEFKGIPDYCSDIMKKLGLIDIEFYSYEDQETNQFIQSMYLVVYRYSGWLFHDYEKSYFYTYNSHKLENIWEGDLNIKPQGQCGNYNRFKVIDKEGINDRWYINAHEFCD